MHRTASDRRRDGFSLLELMVVIVIIAVAATGANFAIGALTQARLRSSAMRLLAASRFAYHRAISKGTTVRVVLDLDSHKLSIEEAHGRVLLASAADRERAEDEKEPDESGGAIDPWEAAKARLSEQEGPTRGRSPFAPIADDDGDPIDRYTPHAFESGVRIVKLTTPHESRPRTSGKGSLYFFPNGNTEHALIELSDPANHVVTVEIAPLTGRGTIHDGSYEPEDLDDPGTAVRDPG